MPFYQFFTIVKIRNKAVIAVRSICIKNDKYQPFLNIN